MFSGYLHSSEIFGPPAIMGLPYNLYSLYIFTIFAKKDHIEGLMLASVMASVHSILIQVPAISIKDIDIV